MAENTDFNTKEYEKINFREINTGDKGSEVADNLLWNFEQLQLKMELLEEQIQNLSKNAYDGKTIWSDSGYTASIKCSPSILNIQENKTQESTFNFDVTVMYGGNTLKPGTDNFSDTYKPYLANNTFKNEEGQDLGTVKMKTDEGKLRFDGKILQGKTGSGTIQFTVTYKGVTYTENFYLTVTPVAADAESYYMSTVFKYSVGKPDTPEGGSFENPVPPTGGWSDGVPAEDPEENERLYMSKRMFCNVSSKSSPTWSEPSIAFDTSDFDVCFSAWDGDNTPEVPTKHGSQDGDTSDYKWHDTGNKDDIWMATSVQSKGTWGEWSIVKIKGENGENGQNGDWKDTIYKNFTTYSSHTKEAPDMTNPEDFVDKDYSTLTERNQGWKNAPDNSDGDWYSSTALINGNTGKIYNSWSTPVLVSKAGKEGDSTFVSTVFKRQSGLPTHPGSEGDYSNPIPAGWSDGIPAMDSESNPLWTTHRRFSTNEGLQDKSWSAVQLAMDSDAFDVCYSNWTGVTAPEKPMNHGSQDGDTSKYKWHDNGKEDDIWMATSHKTSANGWSDWCITKIKGENGSQGDYMNFIFKQKEGDSCDAPNIGTPSNFVDKSNDEIVDDKGQKNTDECNQGWHDGPGIGDNWWMCCALIGGSTGKITGEEWSKTSKLSGKDGVNGNYIESQYAINSSETIHPDSWYETVEKCYNAYGQTYLRSGDYMWMRQRNMTWNEETGDYVEGNWGYMRVTGEKGESGSGIKIKGNVSSYEELFSLTGVTDGDGYIINDDLWLWYESSDYIKFDNLTPDEQTAYVQKYGTKVDQGKWRYVSRFAGSANYIHIKYAEVLDRYYTTSEGVTVYYPSKAGNTPNKYIGVLCDTNEEAPDGESVWSGYTWSQFQGDDGYGYEYIYRTRANSTPYNLDNSSDIVIDKTKAEKDDYVPENWTDNPSGVNSGTPYEFMFMRKKENGKWGDFKGTSQNNKNAILYNYYGRDAEHQQYQWGVFKSLVFIDEMKDDSKWHSTIKEAGDYDIAKGEYLWERERTITPAHGDTPEGHSEWSYIRKSGEKGDKGDTGTGIQLKGAKEDYASLFGLADKCIDTSNPTAAASHQAQSPLPENGDCYSVNGHLWVWTESADAEKYDSSTVTDFYNTYKTYNYKMKWSDCGQIKGEPGDTPYVHIKYATQATYGTTSYKVTDLSWLTDNHGSVIGKFKAMWADYSETADMTNIEFVKSLDFVQDNGEDGIDFEYIYTRTSENTAPAVPTVTSEMIDITKSVMVYNLSDTINASGEPLTVKDALYQSSDVIPNKTSYYKNGDENINITNNNWTDNPMGPTDVLQYEWCCKRQKKNGAWGGFIGRADNTGLAFLYNRYGQDGEDALTLNVTNQSHCYRRRTNESTTTVETVVMKFEPTVKGVVQTITDIDVSYDATRLGFKVTANLSNRTLAIKNGMGLLSDGSFDIDITVKDYGTYTVTYSWTVVYDGEKGEDGEDGTSISIKGQCVDHYTNYAAMPSTYSYETGSLILFDDASDFPQSSCSSESVLSGVPSVAQYVSSSDYTWAVSVASIGDAYVDTDGNLWVAGESAWTNVGHIKGEQGVGIESVNTYYALSSGYTESPEDSEYKYDTLDNVVIAENQDKYVWSAAKVTLTDKSISITGQYCVGKCSELASVTEQYGTSNKEDQYPSDWDTKYPEITEGKYIWTRNSITWKDGKSTTSGARIIGYVAVDGSSSLYIYTTRTPLVFDTEEDGLVASGVTKYATLKVYQNGNDITSAITSGACSVNNLTANGYSIRGWGGKTITVTIMGSGITSTEMSDGTRISNTSGSLTVGFKYNNIDYSATFPFSVNLNKYTHKISVTNKELISYYEHLSGATSSLTKQYSEIKQTCDNISLKVGEATVGRSNLLKGTACNRQGEGWTKMTGTYASSGVPIEYISTVNALQGVNSLVCKPYSYIDETTSNLVDIIAGFHWGNNAPQGNIPIERDCKYTLSFWAKVEKTTKEGEADTDKDNVEVVMETIWSEGLNSGRTEYAGPSSVDGEGLAKAWTVDKSGEWQHFTRTMVIPPSGDTATSKYNYLEVGIFARSKTTDGKQHTVYISRPMMEKSESDNGWTLSKYDTDPVCGNMLECTQFLKLETDKNGNPTKNLTTVSGTVTDNQYEDCSQISASTIDQNASINCLVWKDISIERGVDYSLSFLAKGTGTVSAALSLGNVYKLVESDIAVTKEGLSYNGRADFTPTTNWQKYTVHWISTNTKTTPMQVVIAVQPKSSVAITRPKLERGAVATDYTTKASDQVSRSELLATGIDIVNQQITVTSNQFIIQNNSGETTASVDKDGKLTVNEFVIQNKNGETTASVDEDGRLTVTDGEFKGTVRAQNFYHGVFLTEKSEDWYYIVSADTEGKYSNMVGKYYPYSEMIVQDPDGQSPYGICEYQVCTGPCDEIFLHNENYEDPDKQGSRLIILPRAKDFEGKIIEIIDFNEYQHKYARKITLSALGEEDIGSTESDYAGGFTNGIYGSGWSTWENGTDTYKMEIGTKLRVVSVNLPKSLTKSYHYWVIIDESKRTL